MTHATQDAATGPAPVHFLVTFWGRKYRDWFLRFTVASLLAPGNAPALQERRAMRLAIATTQADWEALTADANFRALARIVEPVLHAFPADSDGMQKYHRMSLGHRMLTQACFEAGAVGINLNPDTLVPDGCVAEALRIVDTGAKVVMCTAVRFDLDGIEAELAAQGRLAADRPLVVSRREAVDLGLRNLHTETQAGNWDAAHFGELGAMHGKNHYPICCYWEVPDKRGIYILTHNWAPFAIDYSRFERHATETFRQWTLDGDYIYANLGDAAEIGRDVHVVEDSDSLFLLGMTPADDERCPAPFYWWKAAPVLGNWAKGYLLNRVVHDKRGVDPLRRRMYPIGAKWHRDAIDDSWAPVLKRANGIVGDFLDRDLDLAANGATGHHAWRAWWYRRVQGRLMAGHTLPWELPHLLRGPAIRLVLYPRAIWRALAGDPQARARIVARLRALLGR